MRTVKTKGFQYRSNRMNPDRTITQFGAKSIDGGGTQMSFELSGTEPLHFRFGKEDAAKVVATLLPAVEVLGASPDMVDTLRTWLAKYDTVANDITGAKPRGRRKAKVGG